MFFAYYHFVQLVRIELKPLRMLQLYQQTEIKKKIEVEINFQNVIGSVITV